MIAFESADLEKLSADFAGVALRLPLLVTGVMEKAAVNVKTDARARFTELQKESRHKKYLPRYASTITYDELPGTENEIGFEIGPVVEPNNQGAFGPGIEFGSRNAPPMPHLGPALDAEEPKLLEFLGDAGVLAVLPP